MRDLLKPALMLVATVALLGGAWYGYRVMFADERAALIAETARFRKNAASYEKELGRQKAVRDRLGVIAQTTLGKQFDRVDHRLRSGLSRVGQDAGLTEVVVSSSPPKDERNPAAVVRDLDRATQERIKKMPNFSVVRAQVKGTGTLPQVLQALAMYDCQSWIHRVDALSIRPIGRERDKFEIKLDVATIWMPDLSVDDPNDPPIVAPGESGIDAIASITGKNVFRLTTDPKPAPALPVAAQAAPPKAPPVAWGDWKLTGIVSGRRGLEALLVNTRDGERRALAPGAGVLGATLVSGAGEEAIFEVEGAMWTVRTGATLADRVRKE